MRKYFRKIQKFLFNLVCFFDGQYFCQLLNVYCILRMLPIRFKFDRFERLYFYNDRELKRRIYFPHKRRALLYLSGIRRRTNFLIESYCLEHVRFSEGDVIFDCGANIGELWHASCFHNIVEYVGFEPSPREYSCLKKNADGCEIRNIALWNEEGIVSFYLDSGNADSSVIEPAHYDEEIQVRAVCLSQYVDRSIKLLKLEAEGAEPEILFGLGDKINNIEYIAADCGFERGLKQESTFIDVINHCSTYGFKVVAINWSRLTVLLKRGANDG